MELIKNIFKYLIILLFLAFLVCGIFIGIMFFFPSTQIFGFKYVANHTDNGISLNESVLSGVTKINIDTDNYDIIIKPNSTKGISSNNSLWIAIHNDYTGFANVNNNGLMIENCNTKELITASSLAGGMLDPNLIRVGNTSEFSLKIAEPSGVVSYGNSYVIVGVPENVTGVEFVVNTNKGEISFAKNEDNPSKMVSTSNITLNVNSARGSFNLDNANMQDGSNLNIKNYLGRVTINSEKIGNVNIDSNSGNFTFKNIGYEGFTGGNLTVTGNNPYVSVDTIYGSCSFQTTTGFLKCKELKGDAVKIKTSNGIVRIDKALKGIDVESESGEITIGQVGDSTSLAGTANVTTNSGAITLGSEDAGVYIHTQITSKSGRVIVKNLYHNNSEISTTKGSVKVDFAKDEKLKNLKVETESGAIELNNVYGDITAKTGKSSKIKAQFISLSNASNFTTDAGEVELILPSPTDVSNKQYNLDLKSKNNKDNKLNITIGDYSISKFEGEKNEEGYYSLLKTFPEDKVTTNTIKVTTKSGKINIHE